MRDEPKDAMLTRGLVVRSVNFDSAEEGAGEYSRGCRRRFFLEITSVNVFLSLHERPQQCFMEWLARGSLVAANPVVVQERRSRVESRSSSRRKEAVQMGKIVR